jgi:hypothetical protein
MNLFSSHTSLYQFLDSHITIHLPDIDACLRTNTKLDTCNIMSIGMRKNYCMQMYVSFIHHKTPKRYAFQRLPVRSMTPELRSNSNLTFNQREYEREWSHLGPWGYVASSGSY